MTGPAGMAVYSRSELSHVQRKEKGGRPVEVGRPQPELRQSHRQGSYGRGCKFRWSAYRTGPAWDLFPSGPRNWRSNSRSRRGTAGKKKTAGRRFEPAAGGTSAFPSKGMTGASVRSVRVSALRGLFSPWPCRSRPQVRVWRAGKRVSAASHRAPRRDAPIRETKRPMHACRSAPEGR